ncbi:oxygen-independent coproporphyrinogen III oxidase [Ammonifex degensii KC4]|uniref:Heme chaperone HemW n=1 Tax=Ammonifex degensii (strain DSM 10501 / KC4) TaxID=429009 RepID=C9RBX4_AMMDK|nr:radical SAM family heme chaperone HemW [Ammonifex degensii]ACX51751.1 oxygen-independent coproporphyrinogen III oxidase [Ammonifex degensii KC4]
MIVAGIYLHVPFCRRKCFYCDFVSYPYREEAALEYLTGLKREILFWREVYGSRLKVPTLYLGGGTPTCLPLKLLEEIFSIIYQSFSFLSRAEVTVEANPETLTPELVELLVAWGVNRLSIGMQALRPEHLKLLGRGHTFAEVVESVKICRRAGLENINLDLIYGLPGQTLADWRETLRAAVALEPTHLSAYALELEEHTLLGKRVAKGELSPCEEETVREMYLEAIDFLEGRGYRHYEISNFALPGKECRHNLGYWRLSPYLGLGPAAHSFLEGKRWANAADLATYLRLLEEGKRPVVEVVEVGRKEAMAEAMFLGLRLRQGVHRLWFAARFGSTLEEAYGPVLERLVKQGLLEYDGGWVRLTPMALPVANQVFMAFV